jgi:glycosyltransferase involved in cell wall biosynthesis
MTRVLRVYHCGRDAGHRRRERALHTAGVDLTLVVPNTWPDAGAERILSAERFPIVELPIRRAGDVNRHRYLDPDVLSQLVREHRPDVLDIQEEPFSLAARQWLRAAGDSLPVVMYTAQNLDKRYPPPFAQYEQQALRRVTAMYPCSRQAASVTRGKGFGGLIAPLPLGYDESLYSPGTQALSDESLALGIVGRLVPEKGVSDAVRVLAAVRAHRSATLHIIGTGPALAPALMLARELDVEHSVSVSPWMSTEQLAGLYRSMHVLLIPSRATNTWVEQFGRVIPEAQSSGAVVAGYASGAIAEVAGPAGLLVDEGAVERLSAEVSQLLRSPEDWSERRSLGLGQADQCTWTKIGSAQAEFYRLVARGEFRRIAPPSGPAQARRSARVEFGPVAATARAARPMALPVLRKSPRLESGLGRLIDLTGECRSLIGRRS